MTTELEYPLLVAGESVITIWPRIDRKAGMSYDTEPYAQPWKARYLGTTTHGELVIQELSGDYPPRTVTTDALKPS